MPTTDDVVEVTRKPNRTRKAPVLRKPKSGMKFAVLEGERLPDASTQRDIFDWITSLNPAEFTFLRKFINFLQSGTAFKVGYRQTIRYISAFLKQAPQETRLP